MFTKEDRINYWIVILISLTIVGYPLVSFIPSALGRQDERIFAIIFRIFYLIIALVCISKTLIKKEMVIGIFWVPILIFWSFYFFRMFYDIQFNKNILITPSEEYVFFGLGSTFIPFISCFQKYNNVTIEKALVFTYWLTFFCDLLIINNIISNFNIEVGTSINGNNRLNYIVTGVCGLILVILSLIQLLFDSIKNSIYKRIILLSSLILGIVVLALSGSRGPFISLAIQFIILIFIALKFGDRKKIKLLSFSILFILITFWNSITLLFETTILRFELGLLEKEMGNESRSNYASEGINAFLNNPITGVGLVVPVIEDHPHNQIIDGFTSTGIIGGFCNLILIFIGLYYSYKIVKFKINYLWLVFMFFTGLFWSLTSGTIYLNSFYYCFLAIIISIGKKNNFPQI